ncbi:hypothetical protein FSP39_012952 [Pinctada imbricata]|uniref:AIG1-type G domain-containing protein n=1 Tax=Pinctada imbricata TaxID=66713 RepID=A0AA88YDC1_PINIB|nr:hypothetical protein FSP39_012952 [Pinctada imbricata]
MSGKSVTKKSQIGRADRFGKKLLLVDTPGIFDTGKTNDEVITEIVKCIGITSPGLHAIILVVHIGRFTEEEKKTVDLFLNHLGQQLIQFLVVVFTRKDDLDRENTTIDEYVDSLEPSSLLAEIIQKSRCRYVAFDNTAVGQQNDDQVKRLFSVIENLIRENGGTFYTNDMYREAEMAMRRRMDEERRRLEEEKRQAIERIEAPFRAKIENERRERESLSHDLALTKMQTASLTHDKSRMEEELEMTKRRSEREAAERENERRRMEEERRRDQEINERRMREIREESQRREDERRREYDQRQRQMEDDRRRDKEEMKKQRKEIERVKAEYDKRMRDQNIREAARDDVEKEKPGILATIIEAVSEVPVIGPVVKVIGKLFKLF